jgi:hypothetical protein
MLTWPRRTLVILAVLELLGCSAGRDFARPPQDSLIIGTTKYKEVLARFGPPFQEGTATRNERALKTAKYAYAEGKMRGTALHEGVSPERAMNYYFLDDVLVGHVFISSFKGDPTDFDASKVKDIRRGETTRKNVTDLLGLPSGLYAYPLVKNEADQGLVYAYAHVRLVPAVGKVIMKGYQKVLVVSVDRSDVVTDIEFTEQGEK